jgi:putative endonuclease
MTRTYYVYILASRSRTLYVGVTNDLVRRLHQHRDGSGSGFTRRYAVNRLVHVDCASNPRDAIAREKQIKQWTRRKKVALIEAANPEWRDLAADWLPDPVPLPGRSRFLDSLMLARNDQPTQRAVAPHCLDQAAAVEDRCHDRRKDASRQKFGSR